MSSFFNDRMTHDALDRAASKRGDAHWVAQQLASDRSLFVPVWRGKVLLRTDALDQPHAAFLSGDAAHRFRLHGGPWVLLGLLEQQAVFAVDVSAVDDPIPLLPADLGNWGNLRTVLALLPAGDAAVLGHALAMIHWRGRHRFCGVCGGACEAEQAGNVLRCTVCKAENFPRTDPAVIMAVTRVDETGQKQVLLARSVRFPIPNLYSVLAGFVEPGENLEQTVAREVMEEVGVTVDQIRYFGSQAWPFPCSIMLGFIARATSDEIVLDATELADARWFGVDVLQDPAKYGISLPPTITIARQMLERWRDEGVWSEGEALSDA